MRKLTYGFYGLGIFAIIVGLIFYHYIFLDHHILSYLSELLYQRRSSYVIYIGIGIVIATFFLSTDFIKIFLWIKKKDRSQNYTKIVIVIFFVLWLININLPPMMLLYFRFLVFALVTIYIGFHTYKLIYLSLLVFITQLADNMLFLYRDELVLRDFWFFTIAVFVMLAAMLIYIVLFVIQFVKKQNYMKYVYIFLYYVVSIVLVSLESLSLNFLWVSSSGAKIIKEDNYMWIELVIYTSITCSLIVINKSKFKIDTQ